MKDIAIVARNNLVGTLTRAAIKASKKISVVTVQDPVQDTALPIEHAATLARAQKRAEEAHAKYPNHVVIGVAYGIFHQLLSGRNVYQLKAVIVCISRSEETIVTTEPVEISQEIVNRATRNQKKEVKPTRILLSTLQSDTIRDLQGGELQDTLTVLFRQHL